MHGFLELPTRARAWMVAVWITGFVLVALQAPKTSAWNLRDVAAWLGLSLVAAVLEQFTVVIGHGPESENFSLTDAIWVPVLIFAKPGVLTLGVLTGIAIGQVARRWAWYKVAYNVAQFVISVTAAEVVFSFFHLPPAPSIAVWCAATLAMVVYFTCNELFIAFIIALVERESLWRVLVLPNGLNLLHAAGNLTIGLLAALVWSTGPTGIPLLIAPMVLVFLAYRGWLHAREVEEQAKERERMQALYEAGQELAGPIDPTYDFRSFLSLVRRMMEASAAELVMTRGDVRVYNSEVGLALHVPPEDPSLPPDHYVSTRPGMVTYSAPIGDETGPAGILAVHRPTPIADAERSILEALASQVGLRYENENLFLEVVAQKGHLSDVISNTSDGIFVVSSDRVLLSWNPAMERITGIPRHEAVGSSCDAVLELRHGVDGVEQDTPVVLRLEDADPQDAQLRRPDGSERWLRYTSNPMPGREGSGRSFVIVARDVTTELEIKQLQRDFVATVSHELRSPLTPLKGFISALRDGLIEDDPRVRFEYYGIMFRSVERLEKLIGDLLDVSRVEAGKLALDTRPFELAPLLEGCVRQSRGELGVRAVDILGTDAVVYALADPFRVDQVVMNLLSNAAKYSTPGSRVELSMSASDTHATVSVHNEGDGIPLADEPHVFERFYRAETGLARETGGIGLGLFICKKLVEAMGGQIALESTEGQGCTFSFTVPTAPGPALPTQGHGAISVAGLGHPHGQPIQAST